MPSLTTTLQERVGFTKTPLNIGDAGLAFASFVNWAIGNSAEAAKLRKAFVAIHGIPEGETTQQHAAAFMDWLIVNHWGEAK